jgi:hypothetical protein
MNKLFILVIVSGCALKGSLLGGGSSTFGASSGGGSGPSNASAPINQPTAVPEGLSEYATRFIRWTNELKAACPAGPTAAPDYGSNCVGKADSAENLYKSVDEKSNAQVQQGVAYLAELRKSFTKWDADEKTASAKRVADYKTTHDLELGEHNASELISQLKAARAGKIESTLISFDNQDAGYVEQRLEMLKKEMPDVADIAADCAKGAGNKDICELAANRDKYWTKLLAMQFDAIIAERLQAWTNTVNGMKDDGLVAVINYNQIGNLKALGADLGKDLGAIGKVLGQTNTKAAIDAKLAKLHEDFMAAVKAKQGTNAWAARAKDAKYQDAAVTKAVHQIDGLSVVRVAATEPTWEVIRGDYNQPVQKNRYIWALMRKAGESFCRLYALTVIEEHMGGGRYGEPRADAGGVAEFYVSTCK